MGTRRYPYTREQAEARIQQAVAQFGKNEARGDLNYRRGSRGVGAFSFLESPRTPGCYRVIGFAS